MTPRVRMATLPLLLPLDHVIRHAPPLCNRNSADEIVDNPHAGAELMQ
jgi:hypothetical protein